MNIHDNDFDKYLAKVHDDDMYAGMSYGENKNNIDLVDKASMPNDQNSNEKDLFDEMNTPNVEYNEKSERMDKLPSKDLFDRATTPNVVETRFDKYLKVDLNNRNASCKLIDLKVIEPCWKSISAESCHKSSKDKTVVGL